MDDWREIPWRWGLLWLASDLGVGTVMWTGGLVFLLLLSDDPRRVLWLVIWLAWMLTTGVIVSHVLYPTRMTQVPDGYAGAWWTVGYRSRKITKKLAKTQATWESGPKVVWVCPVCGFKSKIPNRPFEVKRVSCPRCQAEQDWPLGRPVKRDKEQ